ncbi:MAG: O-antigen ligase family protein [Planctomycetes bacterium]|nr:O-antigen ligase family protein [Planctomycetota bacterium]
MILVLGLRHPAVFQDRPAIGLLTLGLLRAAFLGTISGASGNDRHVEPSSFLIASVWTSFAFRAARHSTWVIGAALLFVSYAAISSGYRSAMAQVAILGVLAYFLKGGWRAVSLYVGSALIALTLIAMALPQHVLERQMQAMRISSILAGEEDASINQRLNEVHDVVNHIRNKWTPFEYIFGAGHGAAFVPIRSNANNINEFGTVHHVHTTPMLLFFRYGIVGALAFVALCWVTAKRFFSIRAGVRARQFHRAEACLTLAMIAYLADSLKHGVLVDPVFSYCAAGILFLEGDAPQRLSVGERAEAALES